MGTCILNTPFAFQTAGLKVVAWVVPYHLVCSSIVIVEPFFVKASLLFFSRLLDVQAYIPSHVTDGSGSSHLPNRFLLCGVKKSLWSRTHKILYVE